MKDISIIICMIYKFFITFAHLKISIIITLMKRWLLLGAIAAVAGSMNAATQVFSTENLGEVTGISANGEYASIYDYEDNRAYLWIRSTGEFKEIGLKKNTDTTVAADKRVVGCWAMGVTDDGMVVGSVLYFSGKQRPAIYKDGEWELLPLSPNALNTNSAIAVTRDGKVIGGYQYFNHPDADIPGAYRPCSWTLEGDEYVLNSYEGLSLPKHQGFYPTCMSYDGSVIAGYVFAGFSSMIPCYIKDGEMNIMATITTKEFPWEYKGKWYCGKDENGKQIWTDDPNDPRIVLFTETMIDGIKNDTEDSNFNGGFQGIDEKGNMYGYTSHAHITDAEEGEGSFESYAGIYNYNTNEWTYDENYQAFTNGLDGKYVFGPDDTLLIDGETTTFTGKFGFSAPKSISAFYKSSRNGQVLGANLYEYNPATGEPQFFPMIVVLDEPLLDIPEDDAVATVGAETEGVTSVYDLDGRYVGASVDGLAAGLYIVRCGEKASKVIVK